MLYISLLGAVLSLLGGLNPDALPADAFSQPMLAGAPDDALVAVYVPDLVLDYDTVMSQPYMDEFIGGWPPEEEDFPRALARYSPEELFALARSEVAFYLTPPDPNDEWSEPEATFVLHPRNPGLIRLMDELAEELGELELPEGFAGLRAFGEEDGLVAYSDEMVYIAPSVEELSHVVHHGYGLGGSARFRECAAGLPERLVLAAYVDLHGLLRLPVLDWESMRRIKPELTPFEERLEAVGVGLTPGEDGVVRVDLTLAEGGPVEILSAFQGALGVPDLIGRYPDCCFVGVEASLENPVSNLARLLYGAFQKGEEHYNGEAWRTPYDKFMHVPPFGPPPPEPEPEIPPEVLAALEGLDALAGDTVGFSLHVLPGEPTSEDAKGFVEELLDIDLDYGDPRVAVYLESPDPGALADDLVLLISGTQEVQLTVEEVEVDGVPGLLLMLEENERLYLLELDDHLLVTPDAASAGFVVEHFSGEDVLGADEAFLDSAANVSEPVGLAAWVDVSGLIEAIYGPEAEFISGQMGVSSGLGFNAAVDGNRISLVGDSPLVGALSCIVFYGF
jgi:hypothetical protein